MLGCAGGRSSAQWIAFDLFGHQLVAHLAPRKRSQHHNPVGGHDVPVPHFGVVLDWDDFHVFAARIGAAGVDFVIAPFIRLQGQIGEQATMFFLDPPINALEFKAFLDPAQSFAI